MVIARSSVDTQAYGSPTLGTWGQVVLLLLVAFVAYFQTWIDIWPYWNNKNATYTHGTLVAIVTWWLIWRDRSTISRIEPRASGRTIPLVILLSALWLLAERANIFIIYATLWPLLALAAVWAGLGFKTASRVAFPLSFLYFAIPIWDYLKPPLQFITAKMAGFLAGVLGVPAAFDGNYATLPTGTIFIAEDCSGAHFLSVALAVGVLAGVLRRDVLRTRIFILIFAGLLSMVFNWLRILLIVLAYQKPDLKTALETMGHLTFGWWVFALDLIVFALVLRMVPRSDDSLQKSQPKIQAIPNRSRNGTRLLLTVFALILLPTTAWLLPRADTYPSEVPSLDPWIEADRHTKFAPDVRWSPNYPGTYWEDRFAVIADSGLAVEVYGNQYHEQTQGNELFAGASFLFDPLNFSLQASNSMHLENTSGQPISIRREILRDDRGTSWLSLYTFVVDNEPIAGARRALFKSAIRSTYSRTAAGILAVAVPCEKQCEIEFSEIEGTFIKLVEAYQKSSQSNI